MLEILFTVGQIVSVAGYLYGAWLVISHAVITGSRHPEMREEFPLHVEREEREAWKSYLACDL